MRSTCPMAKACRVPRRSRSGGTGAPGGISPEPRLLKRVTLLPPSIPLAEAKNKLSELIDRVSRGEAIVISRHPTDMARLVPIGRASQACAPKRHQRVHCHAARHPQAQSRPR